MESAKKLLRQLEFTIMEAFTNFRRSGWMAWIVITTMTSSLTVFGAFLMLMKDFSFITSTIGSKVQIVAFLKKDAPLEKLQLQVSSFDGVANVEVVSKDKAWQDLKNDLKNSLESENIQNQNPLPDTLQINLKTPQDIEMVAQRIKSIPEIEEIKYSKELADYVEQFSKLIRMVGILITSIFAFATLAIIVNTIRLAVNSRKMEIEIMRLVGATNWFIRLPFLLEGVFFGFFSAVFTSIFLIMWRTFSLSQIKLLLPFIPIEEEPNMIWQVISATMIISIIVGLGGSAFSVTRYLSFEKAGKQED